MSPQVTMIPGTTISAAIMMQIGFTQQQTMRCLAINRTVIEEALNRPCTMALNFLQSPLEAIRQLLAPLLNRSNRARDLDDGVGL